MPSSAVSQDTSLAESSRRLVEKLMSSANRFDPASKPKLAFVGIADGNPDVTNLLRAFDATFFADLQAAGKFTILERDRVNQLRAQREREMSTSARYSDEVESSWAVKTGKLLAADLVLVLTPVSGGRNSNWLVQARIINVKDNSVLSAAVVVLGHDTDVARSQSPTKIEVIAADTDLINTSAFCRRLSNLADRPIRVRRPDEAGDAKLRILFELEHVTSTPFDATGWDGAVLQRKRVDVSLLVRLWDADKVIHEASYVGDASGAADDTNLIILAASARALDRAWADNRLLDLLQRRLPSNKKE